MALERYFNPVIRPFSQNITNLPGARLHFYAAGTTTPKLVYQDKFGDVPHANPVLADSTGTFDAIFLDGLYRVELTDANGVTQAGWPIDNIGNDQTSFQFSPWVEIFSYSINNIVLGSDGNWYISLTNENLGNNPADSPAEWARVAFIQFWSSSEVYAEEDLVIWAGDIWRSVVSANQGNEPSDASEQWTNLADYVPPPVPPTLYKGPWEAQTGQAVPPYWVDYGGGENLFLHSEDLSQAGAWIRGQLETPVDSGVAAPSIDGESFGNYWKLIPNTTSAQHFIYQGITPVISSGSLSFLVRSGEYTNLRLYVTPDDVFTALAGFILDTDTGVLSAITGFDSVSAEDKGDGDWFITADWSDIVEMERVRIYINGTTTYAGNGTDGLLLTRLQYSQPKARYIKTTDTAVPYTPPKIYELQAPVDEIENEDDPITDGGTLWKEVGSGSGGDATGPYSIVPSVELSANDQDGSGNIAVTLDLSEGTVWTIDCTNSPLMSTNGNINVTVTGLPEDSNTGITFQVYFKQAGRKGVNWTLPAGVTASWAGTQSYGSLASSVDVVQGYWLSSEPSTMNFSIIDKR